ncbi:MAG TPA: C4-type zinc ribbon domain-containing protein [Candidatus Goldiibacteriota bacterium]|nr:C4-type zinc ribbon domain-containing protein [Candidatus Goldiibacteriota bacterium]
MEDVSAIIGNLVSLQEADNGIMAVEAEKEELLRGIEGMKERISQYKAEFDAKKKKLDEARKAKAMVEMEIKSKESDIKKKEEQSAMIKTNEAYKALQEEVGAIRREIKSLEEKELQIMEEEDLAHKWLKEQEVLLKKQEEEIAGEIKKFEAAIAEKEASMAGKKKIREEKAASVNRQWYEKYERIRKNKGGLALAEVILDNKNNGVCGGCKMAVRAQKVIELKKKKEIFICENCARIMYVRENA